MNTKIVVPWIIVFAGVLGVMWFVGAGKAAPAELGSEPAAASRSAATSTERFYDFGNISMADGLVRRQFTVTNPSTAPLTFTKLYTSCMCTRANFITSSGTSIGQFGMPGMDSFGPKLSAVLMPGESARVEAIFDPAAHGPAGVGPIERQVMLEDSSGGVLTFGFRANVTP